MPAGLESSSTNIASDQGAGKERRSIAITDGRSLYASRRTDGAASATLFGIVSLTPPLRVGRPQVDRGGRLAAPPRSPARPASRGRRAATRCTGSSSSGTSAPPSRQLIAKSYRPGPRRQRRPGGSETRSASSPRESDPWPPEAHRPRRVASGEDFAAPSVEHGQPLAPVAAIAGEAEPEAVEGADPGHRHPDAGAERPRSRDPDPQAGEGPRAEPDSDPVDGVPSAGRRRRPLDLRSSRRSCGPGCRRPPRPINASWRTSLAAYGADGGVLGRRVEADQRQVTWGPGRRRNRPSCP